jgi:hypothetical protein
MSWAIYHRSELKQLIDEIIDNLENWSLQPQTRLGYLSKRSKKYRNDSATQYLALMSNRFTAALGNSLGKCSSNLRDWRKALYLSATAWQTPSCGPATKSTRAAIGCH